MKQLIMIVVGCFVSLVTFGDTTGNSVADVKNLCDINLNKLANYRAQYAMTTGEPEDSQLKELHAKARKYKEAGDTKNCIAVSEQALSIIAQHSNN